MSDMGYSRMVDKQEEANEQACQETALKNGYTAGEWLFCEGGKLNCAGCPWKDKGKCW